MERNPRIARLRADLATRSFDQGVHWRILFLGRSVNGSTDIVSCLSRSLRNLGHRVLDIDFKRHRGLVDNPQRAQGGNGPVYVRIDELEPVLERFAPQMIVCCAGGLTFQPADAQALKQRGIVLVGVTLSDPDVFPSVHPHAHVFDFHTTNARVAMPMYRDAGIHNTLYFPFGIDRGFVTQTVPAAPELAADVICIGHATSRPERNAVMKGLAAELDVRTYGRGWKLPHSEVVEGRRMVQASREGRIHVNFPLTRAGYINIKCGVFESVGSGALVATGRFDEMADFFRYDEEILGYEDEPDLLRQLQAILREPERYREMTERAFERLVGEHLYEHRWMALFEQIQSVAGSGDSWLGEERAAQVRGVLSQSLPRAKHVLLSGFYGASNAGDELILRSISERLEAADPAAQVWVGAENPEQVERRHGLQAFTRRNLSQALHAARTASATVLGGGGLWHDYTFERSGGLLGFFQMPQISIAGFGALPLMGRMFEAPFHVVGMGVGPLEDPDARRMVRFLATQAESIMVRDAESAGLLEESGVPAELVRQAPDVVYGLQLPVLAEPAEVSALRGQGRRIVGLNLRPWAHVDEDVLVEQVVQALLAAGRAQPLALVGIPMQAGDRVDPMMLARVATRVGEQVPALVLRAPLSPEDLVATLASLDVLVSMRLHACLLTHRLGRPVVGIAYDPKVANHFAELGRAVQCLPLPLPDGGLEQALQAALDEGGQLPVDVLAKIRQLEADASAALDEIAQQVARAPARQVVFEVPRFDGPARAGAPATAVAPKATPAATPAAVAKITGRTHVTAGAIRMPTGAIMPDDGLQAWLTVDEPNAGDAMEVAGTIEVQGRGDVELDLVLSSPYKNEKALNHIFYRLEVGDRWRFTEDLAAHDKPVQLRLFVRAPAKIPVRLAVYVERTCFSSSAWPRLSRVGLELGALRSGEHGVRMQLVGSRGRLQRIPAPLSA